MVKIKCLRWFRLLIVPFQLNPCNECDTSLMSKKCLTIHFPINMKSSQPTCSWFDFLNSEVRVFRSMCVGWSVCHWKFWENHMFEVVIKRGWKSSSTFFKLRKGASITHFVSRSVCLSQKFIYNYMHYLMDNPYISHSYMTHWMEEEESGRGGGGGGRGRA